MRILILIIITIHCSITFAQKIHYKKVSSVQFNTERDIKLYLPKGHDSDTLRKYPVAIVLNNDYLFDIYLGNSKIYAAADLTPEQIVVGVDVNFNGSSNTDVSTVRKNGGLTNQSKKFYDYIKEELIPYLEANYKTSPYLTIIGDGEAANFLLHFLKEPNPIFNAYVAISPNLTDQSIRLLTTYNLKRLDALDNQFYLYMSSNAFEKQERKNYFEQAKVGLTSLKLKNLHLAFKDYKDVPNKPTALVKAPSDIFSTIFELYPKISKDEYRMKIKDLSPLEAIEYLESKYIEIEYLYGTNLNVRFEDIYAIENIVINKQDGDYLRVLGDFVMIKHPESHLGEYYVGMFHELGKNFEQALFYYKEAYGKMELSNPKTELFYENIIRVKGAIKSNPEEDSDKEENLDDDLDDED